jgi:hypothetical protein
MNENLSFETLSLTRSKKASTQNELELLHVIHAQKIIQDCFPSFTDVSDDEESLGTVNSDNKRQSTRYRLRFTSKPPNARPSRNRGANAKTRSLALALFFLDSRPPRFREGNHDRTPKTRQTLPDQIGKVVRFRPSSQRPHRRDHILIPSIRSPLR